MNMVEQPSADADDTSSDANQDANQENEDMQPMDFGIFVLSLNASALIQLGDAQGETAVSLPLARQTIDILSMLEAKTRGNLSGHEERLLHQVLFDLRMRYSRRAGG
jgi:hypothetical protein